MLTSQIARLCRKSSQIKGCNMGLNFSRRGFMSTNRFFGGSPAKKKHSQIIYNLGCTECNAANSNRHKTQPMHGLRRPPNLQKHVLLRFCKAVPHLSGAPYGCGCQNRYGIPLWGICAPPILEPILLGRNYDPSKTIPFLPG